MAEWSKAAVLKTVEVQASGGSNPSLPAIETIYLSDYDSPKKYRNGQRHAFSGNNIKNIYIVD